MKFVRFLSKVLFVFSVTIYSIVSFSFAENEKWPSCKTAISNFNVGEVNSFYNVKNLIRNFCQEISDIQCVDDGDFFDANQSVLLSILCDNVGMESVFTSINRNWENSFLKRKTFLEFNIQNYEQWSEINYCDYTTNVMNGCNLYEHLPKIFNEILNDYFNIWQSRIYGIKWLQDDFDPALSANEFSNHNFLLQICDSSNNYYNTSCKYLKNYMKDARNLLTKTKVIDVKKMSEINKDIDCENHFSENILYCGLLWSQNDFNDDFINVIYNEYFWYRIFMTYYSNNLSQNAKLSSLNTSSSVDKLSDNKDKVFTMQQYTSKIRYGINTSFRTLSDMSWTFPLHIWFTMYQENANILMKNLAKIYPPIRTLFDKLRNVQKTE